jgi:hypothetical protein
MAVISVGKEVANRANEAILHESFTIRCGIQARNCANEATSPPQESESANEATALPRWRANRANEATDRAHGCGLRANEAITADLGPGSARTKPSMRRSLMQSDEANASWLQC